MDFLKSLFEAGPLSWEQFSAAVSASGYKLADLATGNYVAKKKYEDDVLSKDSTIQDLSAQIKTRDTDIATLRKSLADGTKDSETKVADLSGQLEKLQGDYKAAKSEYETRLSRQAYEFAVKEFVGGLDFTSTAARRDFTREMLSADLKMKDGAIIGATDFADVYKKANSDAFVVPAPEPEPNQFGDPKPVFVQPTTPQPNPAGDNPFDAIFNFAGVRAH